jgi:hypothetical protein
MPLRVIEFGDRGQILATPHLEITDELPHLELHADTVGVALSADQPCTVTYGADAEITLAGDSAIWKRLATPDGGELGVLLDGRGSGSVDGAIQVDGGDAEGAEAGEAADAGGPEEASGRASDSTGESGGQGAPAAVDPDDKNKRGRRPRRSKRSA